MIVNLYSFGKAKNSTKQPVGNGTKITGNIVGPSSIFSPSISFANPAARNNNYAYIEDYGRYYFIIDWTYDKGFWIAGMSEDVLATWKSTIGSSTQYVLRSAADFDGDIIDTLYPAKAGVTTVTSESLSQEWYNAESSYIVGIVGRSVNGGTGAVNYYQMSESVFISFSNALLGSAEYLGSDFGTQMTLDLLKAQVNPFQYVVSCIRVPIKYGGTAANSVDLGWYTLSVPGAVILPQNATSRAVFSMPVPHHPQALDRGNFLNSEPFTRYSLYIPCFGSIPIPAGAIKDAETLFVYADVDLATGAGILRISNTGDFSNLLAKSSAQVGVPVQLGQITTNAMSAISSTVGAFAHGLTGQFMGMASSIGTAVDSMLPQMSTSGSNGSYGEFQQRGMLVAQFTSIADEDREHNGRPLCKKKVLATLPGYMVIQDPDVEFAGNSNEQETIQKFMEEGFYFE